ncbi:MAG: hypothetical protein ACI81L_003104 [Verrucomicrobiales bacterium]|jgi:hypothetical protein
MDTFPYNSWEEALADADGTTGYFTWANGSGSVVLAILGITLALLFIVWLTKNEDDHLAHCSSNLNEKWGC